MSFKRTLVTALALAAIPVPAAQAYHLEDGRVAPQPAAQAVELRSPDARDQRAYTPEQDASGPRQQQVADSTSGSFPWEIALLAGLGVTLLGGSALTLRHRNRVAPTA
jgi:hypothetical protein